MKQKNTDRKKLINFLKDLRQSALSQRRRSTSNEVSKIEEKRCEDVETWVINRQYRLPFSLSFQVFTFLRTRFSASVRFTYLSSTSLFLWMSLFCLFGCGVSVELKKGAKLFQNRDYIGALEQFTRAVQSSPQSAEAHYRLGLTYYHLGQYNEAVKAYRKAVKLAPEHTEFSRSLGEALWEAGDKRTAMVIWLNCLESTKTPQEEVLKIAGYTGDIYQVTQLTDSGGNYEPSFSPDGRQVVFTSHRDRNGEIYVMDADGRNQKRLTNSPDLNDYGASFSSDGKQILFATKNEVTFQAYLTLQASGSTPRDEMISIIDMKGKLVKKLTSTWTTVGNPVFSPDNKWVAFEANPGGNLDTYVMNINGKNRRRLTTHPGDDGHPSFSPDGKKIVFSSRRENFAKDAPCPNGEETNLSVQKDSHYEIYIMNVSEGNQQRLTVSLADNYEPTFSPDGEKIAFVSNRRGDMEIFMCNADGTGVLQVTNSIGISINPAFSPDSKKLAFVSDRSGYLEIFVLDLTRPVSKEEVIRRLKRRKAGKLANPRAVLQGF